MCIYFSFNPCNNSMRLTLVLTQTGITKYNRLDALNNKKIFLTVLDAVGADSRCYQGCCLMRALSLGCRQPPSPSGLTSPFFVVWIGRTSKFSGISSLRALIPP